MHIDNAQETSYPCETADTGHNGRLSRAAASSQASRRLQWWFLQAVETELRSTVILLDRVMVFFTRFVAFQWYILGFLR